MEEERPTRHDSCATWKEVAAEGCHIPHRARESQQRNKTRPPHSPLPNAPTNNFLKHGALARALAAYNYDLREVQRPTSTRRAGECPKCSEHVLQLAENGDELIHV